MKVPMAKIATGEERVLPIIPVMAATCETGLRTLAGVEAKAIEGANNTAEAVTALASLPNP